MLKIDTPSGFAIGSMFHYNQFKKNYSKNPNKLNYIYVITPKGISEKAKLTLNFMKRKMKEYEDLKKELEKSKSNVDSSEI